MVSNVLCDLAAGDLVDLSAPTGGFRLPEGDAPLVFITAGIGAAMLRSVDEHRSVTFKRAGRPRDGPPFFHSATSSGFPYCDCVNSHRNPIPKIRSCSQCGF